MLSNYFIENWLTKELAKLNRELLRKSDCLNSLKNKAEKYQIVFAKYYLLKNSSTYFSEF